MLIKILIILIEIIQDGYKHNIILISIIIWERWIILIIIIIIEDNQNHQQNCHIINKVHNQLNFVH